MSFSGIAKCTDCFGFRQPTHYYGLLSRCFPFFSPGRFMAVFATLVCGCESESERGCTSDTLTRLTTALHCGVSPRQNHWHQSQRSPSSYSSVFTSGGGRDPARGANCCSSVPIGWVAGTFPYTCTLRQCVLSLSLRDNTRLYMGHENPFIAGPWFGWHRLVCSLTVYFWHINTMYKGPIYHLIRRSSTITEKYTQLQSHSIQLQ